MEKNADLNEGASSRALNTLDALLPEKKLCESAIASSTGDAKVGVEYLWPLLRAPDFDVELGAASR